MARPDPRKHDLDVVAFGEILWDIFEASPYDARVEPIARLWRRELGGAPANLATVLARLGLRAAVVGGVGKDLFGDALVAHLAADGVDTRFVLRLPNRTGLTFVTRDAHGEPRFLFYRHDTADVALRPDDVTPAMGNARWALVGTSTLMTPRLAAATERFLEQARRHRAAVVVDLNVRAHLWKSEAVMRRTIGALVAEASLVKASAADLDALAGAGRGEAWLRARARAPGAAWVLTRGKGPATARGVHGEVTVPTKVRRCVDATGAGDAFLAGVLATLCAAKAEPGTIAWADPGVWKKALTLGHALGAKAVAKPGAVAALTNLAPERRRLHVLAAKAKKS